MRRTIWILIGAGVAFLFWRGCDDKQGSPFPPAVKTAAPAISLKESETARVVIDTRRREIHYALRQADGSVVRKSAVAFQKAEVTVKDSGEVLVKTRSWGFLLEPGLALLFDRGFRPAGDLRFLAVRDFGALVGLYKRDTFRAYVGASYQLRKLRLNNVGLWAGANLQGEVIGGIRVALN